MILCYLDGYENLVFSFGFRRNLTNRKTTGIVFHLSLLDGSSVRGGGRDVHV